jgi:hypothetical protein
LLGDQLAERRAELRATLPIGRVVGLADIAALAVHIMTNTALTTKKPRCARWPSHDVDPPQARLRPSEMVRAELE